MNKLDLILFIMLKRILIEGNCALSPAERLKMVFVFKYNNKYRTNFV